MYKTGEEKRLQTSSYKLIGSQGQKTSVTAQDRAGPGPSAFIPYLPFLSSGFCWLCVSLHPAGFSQERGIGGRSQSGPPLTSVPLEEGPGRVTRLPRPHRGTCLPGRPQPHGSDRPLTWSCLLTPAERWLALRSPAQLLSFASTCEASSPGYIPSASNTQSGLCCPCQTLTNITHQKQDSKGEVKKKKLYYCDCNKLISGPRKFIIRSEV